MKVAVIGAPGSGKTTLSTGIFYNLKLLGKNVEIVPELIKYKVYKGESFSQDGFDVTNTIEQKNFETIFDHAQKQGQLSYVICEAPLCNGFFYSSFYKKKLEESILRKIAVDSINSYDVILFVEMLDEAQFVEFGRKENRERARALEIHIKDEFSRLGYKNKLQFVNQRTGMEEILKIIGVL